MNSFNNAEQDTSKLFLFFQAYFFVVMHKDSNTFVVVVVVKLILTLQLKILIYNNSFSNMGIFVIVRMNR